MHLLKNFRWLAGTLEYPRVHRRRRAIHRGEKQERPLDDPCDATFSSKACDGTDAPLHDCKNEMNKIAVRAMATIGILHKILAAFLSHGLLHELVQQMHVFLNQRANANI